jgi:hypothetical protein
VTPSRALRVARWIDAHRWAVLVVSVLVAVVGGLQASGLPVYGDVGALLPPHTRSVRDLSAVYGRLHSFGTVSVAVESDDPALRARAAADLERRLRALGPDLVRKVTADTSAMKKFTWDNRFLYVPIEDLRTARRALEDEIARAKLDANPLYVDFEDESLDGPSASPPPAGGQPAAPAAPPPPSSEQMRERLRQAKAERDAPAWFVSKDDRLQVIYVQAAFGAGDMPRSTRLVRAIDDAIAESRAALGPGFDAGMTGDVVVVRLEQQAVVHGAKLATLLTAALVLAALLLYYRSFIGVFALLWALAVGSLATFGVTRMTIGHLNLATAFLTSIVMGNGINSGIMWMARYCEERRNGHDGVESSARAIAGTWRGTLAAALAAAGAYASLVITDFRGFRHFGVIGALGMVLCWIAAYTVLPATLAVLARKGLRPRREPPIGRVLAALVPRRPALVATLGLAVTFVAGVITWRYIAGNPREQDLHAIRSLPTGSTDAADRWTKKIGDNFGLTGGVGGSFVVLAPTRAEATATVQRFLAADAPLPAHDRLWSSLFVLDDFLPKDQEEKLRLLGEIRELLNEDNLALMDADDRAELSEVKPPAGLRALGDDDLPEELALSFTERDGTRGRLVWLNHNDKYDAWKVPELRELIRRVRAAELGDGVTLASQAFVYHDIIEAMDRDGPRASLAAFACAMIVVAIVLGVGAHGLVALVSALAGVLFMITGVSLLGMKVNFLNYIALPITIGIGMDYSVNVVARARAEGAASLRAALAGTGSAVLLCSYTTVMAYASLRLSNNLGVRSFGVASLLGELSCLVASLMLAPALLQLAQRALDARQRRDQPDKPDEPDRIDPATA